MRKQKINDKKIRTQEEKQEAWQRQSRGKLQHDSNDLSKY